MKLSSTRRYRGSPSRSRESAMSKKYNQHEHVFFAGPSQQSFFKPNIAIQRKCAHCEAEEKTVKRMADEEEKKVQKTEDKKEEDKTLHRQGEKKEEENIQKMTDKKEEIHREPEKKEEEVHREPEKKEEEIHREPEKKEEDTIHKMEDKKDEKDVHRATEKKEEEKSVSKKESSKSKSSSVETGNYIRSLKGKGSRLPKDAQHFFGERMGHDFSNVRIHTDAAAEQSAKDINAKAYTVDNNIVFNKGQYNPASAEGKKLLAHELTHVAQQQGNDQELLSRVIDNIAHADSNAVSLNSYAKAGTQNKRAYGCEGVNVQGHTDANYSNSFDPTVNAKPSTTCKDCDPPDCITVTGTLVSTFTANPAITLPSVPDGLSACETRAVTRFINTTLKHHEQQHVAAFNTYNGVKRTPYKFTGCKADFDNYMQLQQVIHNDLNDKKMAEATAKSDALDPFSPTIPCECD